MKSPPNNKIHWLTDEQYQKAVTSLTLHIGSVLHPLRMYGQDVYVDQAIGHIVKLAEDFGLRVRGLDHPIEAGESTKIKQSDDRE